MSKRTICLLNDSFPPEIDGVANAVVNYAKNITKSGENAIVVTPTMPGADDSAFPFPVLRYPSIDTRKKLGYVAGYPFSPETARVLTEQKVELMHTHCPITSCLLARSLRAVVDAPLVLTYHTKYDVDIAKAVRGKLLQESAIRALVQNIASCDEVWVVSRGAGENLRSLGYEGDYIVMENGVDVPRGRVSDEAIAAATGRYDLPQNVPVFLFVGRLMWYKGIRIILDALKTLREKNVDFRMVFVGEGADGAEIRSYAEERKLSDRCFFTGAISDREIIRAWYGRSDLFLFPSTFDTNGLVVREAAASGTATVMIRNSCASEGVGDRRNGFCIEENAAAMAAKLEELCRAPEVMQVVGENAQRELYVSWETAVQRAMARYEVVIDNYRSGKYPKRERFGDEFFKTQGGLMKAFASVGELSEEIAAGLRIERDEALQTIVRSRQELHGRFGETKQELAERYETILQKVDRYL